MTTSKIKTLDVLKVIALGGLVISSAVAPNLPIALSIIHKQWKNINKKDLGRIAKRLQKQQMISIKESNGLTRIEITDKGSNRILEYDFEELELKVKKRDGKWRLIIFDIPENQKRSRDAFRKKLIELGCIRVQDSVFASAYPCKNEIDFMCHYLQISKFVTLIKLDKFERGDKLLFKNYQNFDE